MATITEKLAEMYEAEPTDLTDEGQEPYERGFADGWSVAALEAIANLGERMGDLDLARNVLFGGLEPQGAAADLLDGLMEDVCPVCDEVPSPEEDGLQQRGINAAVRYLENSDYEVLEQGWKCVFGSVDIVALDPTGVLAFIDVKTRRNKHGGMPEETVTAEKRRQCENIALSYMVDEWDGGETTVRFDAISIAVNGADHALLRHHSGYLNCVA